MPLGVGPSGLTQFVPFLHGFTQENSLRRSLINLLHEPACSGQWPDWDSESGTLVAQQHDARKP